MTLDNTSSEDVSMLTNPNLLINCRYDMKRIKFIAKSNYKNNLALFSIYRTVINPNNCGNNNELSNVAKELFDFDFKIVISSKIFMKIFAGLSIGILLSAPHVISAFSNPLLNTKDKVCIGFISIVSSVIAGIIATFSIERNV